MNCELLRTMHKGIIYLEDEEDYWIIDDEGDE